MATRLPGFGALAIGLTAAFLAGCGAQNGARAVPLSLQSRNVGVGKADTNQDLLYIDGIGGPCRGICVFAYPSGQYVESISVPKVGYVCTDTKGDVFVTVPGNKNVGYIYEYAHGATQPIQILGDFGYPNGCSVDPSTGNLAVTNYFASSTESGHGNVAIYAHAHGTPTYYKDPNIYWYRFCSYDSSGNLLVNGNPEESFTPYAILPKGSSTFTDISFNGSVGFGQIQWDGQYFALGTGYKGSQTIDQVSISGSSGTIVSQTQINGDIKHVNLPFWIQGKNIMLTFRPPGRPRVTWLGYWNYPDGGQPQRVLKRVGGLKLRSFNLLGIAVSVASSHSRVRY
jgi:hypothetical protein